MIDFIIGEDTVNRLSQKPIEQADLGETNRDDSSPGESVSQTETGLPGFSEPKLELRGAELNQVAIAQDGIFNRLTVHTNEGIGVGPERKASLGSEIDQEVLVPNARVLKLEIGICGASNPYRKTAGCP